MYKMFNISTTYMYDSGLSFQMTKLNMECHCQTQIYFYTMCKEPLFNWFKITFYSDLSIDGFSD